MATDIYLILMLICLMGGAIFTISGIINLFKRKTAKEEWKRALIFFLLTIFFFISFGLTL